MSATLTTLLELSDELDRIAEELAFVGHAVATGRLDTGVGAGFVIMRIRDQVASLSHQAMAALKANPEEGPPHD